MGAKMLIGLTGRNAAGKGTVAEYLKERSFYYESLSDAIRDEAKMCGRELTRENLISIGNELRQKLGAGVLAERILGKLEQDKNYVIDSIRNPEEALALKKRGNFFLVCVEASAKKRFERIKKRGREKDPKTVGEFSKLEKMEAKSSDPASQQLEATIALADKRVVNDGTIEQLHRRVESMLRELPQNFERPGWDEYFINVAKTIATRSNCVKRKVAALIVKDKRIISTGYNGTPRGVANCNEGGCPRCNSFAKSGTALEECICSHAEENAIVQAAYHGVNLKGGILYCTFSPCLNCSKMIINAGIERVVFNADYPLSDTAKRILKEAGIELEKHKM